MTATPTSFDASKPLYACVGAADLAVEKLRGAATEAQQADLKAFATQVREQVAGWQAEAGALLDRAEDSVVTRATTIRSDLAEVVEEYAEALEELAVRGQGVVARLRDDAVPGDGPTGPSA